MYRQLLPPCSRGSDPAGGGWLLKLCISNQLPSNSDAAEDHTLRTPSEDKTFTIAVSVSSA